ncbi:MAG: hypothetical protein SLAVMIC_00048 [uncultured marine phage]|uniref:Uncharacterized protein n=1 Tax=uncultured marine phage TaxID=707152 RepID=A0A8D9C890_9VIRU|nr:MAG: hypothetical protein SLAVMIC_00048 [uncultured marine phage]
MSKWNFANIAKQVSDELLNTQEIDTIEIVISSFEKLNEGESLTKDILIPIPSLDRSVRSQLDINQCEDVIENMMETCIKLEEYEMCSRIQKLQRND